jgi:hypothetical protein
MKKYHWWKDKNKAWNKIAKNIWPDAVRGSVDDDTKPSHAWIAFMSFERIAFLYEIHARRDWTKKPQWIYGVPFDELHLGHIDPLRKALERVQAPFKWSKGAGLLQRATRAFTSPAGLTVPVPEMNFEHRHGEINLGKLFAGISIEPSRASIKGVQEYLLGEVLKYAKANGLKFSKPREGEQHKPLDFKQIEFLDALHAKKGTLPQDERNRKAAIFSTYKSELAHIHG